MRYRTILADPPWPEETKAIRRSGEDVGFSLMSYEDINRMPVSKIALPDSHLYLWATQRSLEHAFETMRKWGFRTVSVIVWCKPLGVSFYYFRVSTEFLLFGVRGNLRKVKDRSLGTHYHWPRGKHRGHSAKPNESYKLIERASDGPYLELFARRRYSEKWDVWGNEVRSAKHLREVLG